ncbi:MAG: hypothetical protein AAF633_19055, partial [Chloroflexota bacterium]
LVGIGGPNRYNLRNPFTLEETEAMLKIALQGADNVTLLPIPDLDDGPRWREMVKQRFGPLNLFVTDNPYVSELMQPVYHVMRPVYFVSPDERIPLNGTMVRLAMACGESWEALVEPDIAKYIKQNGLDSRFRKEFGLQAIAKG